MPAADLRRMIVIDEALAADIRAARKRRGLTQREVADQAGIGQNTFVRIEQGRQYMHRQPTETRTTVDTLARVLHVLALPVASTLRTAGVEADVVDEAVAGLPTQATLDISDLSEEDQRRVLTFIQTLRATDPKQQKRP